MQQANLGMIGGGTVGSGVFHALERNGDLMAARIGVKVNVRRVAVKALDEPRPYEIPASLMTTDWQSVVEDPQVDIVAELVGGTTLARTMILTALKLGKPVITANKALLSAHGNELFAAARRNPVTNLYYEASVCGGIPIIKSLREGFVGNRITQLYGIVNGTCNYILTRMKLEGADFDAVLKDAQAQGYAEAEPSLDIDGHDALHKIGILASLAHGFWVKPEDIYVEGIRSITRMDIQFRGPARLHHQAAGHHQELACPSPRAGKSEKSRPGSASAGFRVPDPGAQLARPGRRQPRLQRRLRPRRHGGRYPLLRPRGGQGRHRERRPERRRRRRAGLEIRHQAPPSAVRRA